MEEVVRTIMHCRAVIHCIVFHRFFAVMTCTSPSYSVLCIIFDN